MCRPEGGQRSLVANGPKLENELKKQQVSINKLSKTAVVDRNTIRSMLKSRKAYESSFRKIAKVLYGDENEWARLTAGTSCVIVTFDFDCELPEGAGPEEAFEFIRANPQRFIECFQRIGEVSSTAPQIADVTVACIRIRMVATAEDAQKLIESFEAGDFARYGVNDVFIEIVPPKTEPRRIWRWFILVLLAAVIVISLSYFLLAQAKGDGKVSVTSFGQPMIDQRSIDGQLNFVPGRRGARLGVNVHNSTSKPVRLGNRCRFDFSNIGVDHDVYFQLQMRESPIVDQNGKATAVYAVNNIDTLVKNLTYSPNKGHVPCTVFISILDVDSDQVIEEIAIPVFVLPGKPGQVPQNLK